MSGSHGGHDRQAAADPDRASAWGGPDASLTVISNGSARARAYRVWRFICRPCRLYAGTLPCRSHPPRSSPTLFADTASTTTPSAWHGAPESPGCLKRDGKRKERREGTQNYLRSLNSCLVILKMILSPTPQISDLESILECSSPSLISIDSSSLVSGFLYRCFTLPTL